MRLRLDGWDAGETAFGDDTEFQTATTFEAPTDGELLFEGVATLSAIVIDGEVVAESESMWVPLRVPISAGAHRVEVRCSPLTPRLAERRKPRARWRQKVAYDGNLRWFRTTLLGRAPGFAPGPPVVGLWRPAWFVAGEPSVAVRCRVEGSDGVVSVLASADGEFAVGETSLAIREGVRAEVRIPSVRLWWPHTHGEPFLYDAAFTPTASIGFRSEGTASDGFRNTEPDRRGSSGAELDRHGWRRRIGFRTIEAPGDLLRDGLTLSLNAIPLFVRGAVWTPNDDVRATLQTAKGAGLNAIRIPGTGAYETAEFHDLCDELGMLVWQDLMFANLDYPFEQLDLGPELDALADVVGGRPSLAVICGGSEIEQQVAMLGLDPALGRPPDLVSRLGLDAVYVPNAPCGATRPLAPDQGVSNWFGVGGYRRPLSEARTAGVRFASECLAIANVCDEGDPRAGAMRDVDSPWDFVDVRDHYLAALYGDSDRYEELSRYVSGDVMSEVLGEWRRAGSPCGGAFVLWLRDLAPGAGWGLLDHRGRPKAVLGALRRVLSPRAIWTTDEGMGGIAVHVANDRPEPLEAQVRVTVYADGEHVVEEAAAPVTVPARGAWTGDAETVLGRWIDVSYAYRFGPPAHDLVVAALETPGGDLLASAEREPLGRSAAAHPIDVTLTVAGGVARISSPRALLGTRLSGAAEDGFLVEPGRERTVAVSGDEHVLSARNLAGTVAA